VLFTLKELNVENLGQVRDFQAVPGYGLMCTVFGIEKILKHKNRKDSKSVNVVVDGKIIDHFEDDNNKDEGETA